MKAIVLAIAFALCACATAPAASETPIQLGTSHTLESAALGGPREINIWLPPDYASGERRYNVLYVLDGGLDQDFIHIAGLGQLGALSWTYEPLIVVGVKTGTRIHELTPPATDARYRTAFANAGGAADFRRHLETEVIPYIESRYRTGPRRALIGESLAGLFVIDTLLQTPALFHDYIAISPSLWWDDRIYARQAPALLARDTVADRRLFLAIANEGGTMQDGVNAVLAAVRGVPDRISLRYSDRSATETHATIYHGAALDALRWLYPMPPYGGETPWYMIDGASPN